MLKKKLWITLLISSSCFVPKESIKINFSDTSDFDKSTYQKVLKDKQLLSQVRQKYGRLCQSCHGYLAEGRVGPNLTDNYWIHGKGTVQDIYKIIRYGVTSKGMRSYKQVLSDSELIAMSHYIKSLKGSSPQKAKKPQGKLVE